MPILYRMWGSLLYVFLLLLIGIFLIQLIIYGFKKDRKWAWGAALIYFMYSISSGIHALYTIEDEFLIIDSFGFLIPIAVISIIIGIIGIYILIQKDVRTEFAIDTALAEFVQKSRGSRK